MSKPMFSPYESPNKSEMAYATMPSVLTAAEVGERYAISLSISFRISLLVP